MVRHLALASLISLAACSSAGSTGFGQARSSGSGTGSGISTTGASGSSTGASTSGSSGSTGCTEGPTGSATLTGGPDFTPIYVVARAGFSVDIANSVDCGLDESVEEYRILMQTADGGMPAPGTYTVGANDAGYLRIEFHEGTWSGDGLGADMPSGSVQFDVTADGGVRGSFQGNFPTEGPVPTDGGAEVHAQFVATWR